jgi:hypothetical protein
MRFFRKFNYSVNVDYFKNESFCKFMQGREGDISQAFYYLGDMEKNYKKWVKLWSKFL